MPTHESPHDAREIAESFGVDADRYDRTRPSYPSGVVEAVLAALSGGSGVGGGAGVGDAPGVVEVVDVGCGTGIVARQFRDAGCRVLGVEPDPRMAEFTREGGIPVEVARFEEWEAAGRRFDAVVCGQAWHWIDPDAGAARAAGVLRPGGVLAIFWNAARVVGEVGERFDQVYRGLLPGAPGKGAGTFGGDYSPLGDRAVAGVKTTAAFEEPIRLRFPWERVYQRDEWLDLLPTTGLFTRMPRELLARVLDEVGATIDSVGGELTVSYTCETVIARRGAA
ncbi:class I SAM-dependent methyltransferase [Actinosynnema pretiosum]|uniref:SAM-dependent methyltransferase n=1 Tax=Actinosynnema pretiosum TaxID=42197 RepID=A0A290ZBD7_9PSEU|nr:class I SAM-dependent methyltransferase [Actinosynnema pretiosum]ATE56361.1 SAM-dependent methyltransferase [Actinosynnema pretiosum]